MDGFKDVELKLERAANDLQNSNGKEVKLNPTDANIFDQAMLWLNANRNLKRNNITLFLEEDSNKISEHELNTIFIDLKKDVPKIVYRDFNILITSNKIPSYNPLLDFFEKYSDRTPTGNIKQLSECISSDTGLIEPGSFYPEYVERFLKKWMVGLVASVHGDNYNPLMVILVGPKNTGKTEYFKRLLPKELQAYFCQSKLDQGKDSEAQMSEKLLILNDELDGFSRRESKTFRNFISASTYNFRPPYGRQNITRKRLATVCGTSNDSEILNDQRNNRRVIIIELNKKINYQKSNNIDKVDLLMEAYNLYRDGFDYNLNDDDIRVLDECSVQFKTVNMEEELISRFFKMPETGSPFLVRMTATDIKDHIETHSKQRIYVNNLGRALKSLGFKQGRSGNNRIWYVEKQDK